ncbi:hypothetical protein CO675_06855 [Bradyrhizobium sp. C9]|nr:hypothetical protein CO675_06855 [Bradyrhizobium sp. C9]
MGSGGRRRDQERDARRARGDRVGRNAGGCDALCFGCRSPRRLRQRGRERVVAQRLPLHSRRRRAELSHHSEIVGPGKAVDTNRYFAICPNMLGSSYGSTNAASIDPRTGRRYGPRFPDITVGDIVATQRAMLDELGIDKLVAIVGPSYGGFQALQWAVNYPDAMRGIAAVVTAPLVPRERAEGNVARLMAVLSQDPNWNGGDYYDHGGVLESMIQIRTATLKTYGIETRLRDTLTDPAKIEAAIRAEAAEWARGFDANSLLTLAKALRDFDVTAQFGRIKAKVLYVLSRTDKLFPPELAPQVMPALKAAGVDADYFLLDSDYGHSASGRDAHKWAPRLRTFMDSLG